MLSNPSISYLHQEQQQQTYLHPKSLLEHVCNLDVDKHPAYVRQTSIVCTAGESWSSPEKLEQMIINGANIIRLNLTLNTREHYEELIKNIRKIEEKHKWNPSVAVAVDITAPTVRTGLINKSLDATIRLKDDGKLTLTADIKFKDSTDPSTIWIDIQFFPEFFNFIVSGDMIYLDDGAVHLLVETISPDSIYCTVVLGGELGSSKRVNLSHNRLYTESKEKALLTDLEWAKKNGVDYIFTSVAETAEKVSRIKSFLGPDIAVLPKIETKEMVLGFPEILAVSDGVIINRGELGIEYPHQKIFKLQKTLISQCNVAKKPVMVINQLLESMCYKPRATRAEVGDVANAVLDGADSLILAVETARGEFPLETLKVMHQTCREAEGAIFHKSLQRELKNTRDAIMFRWPGCNLNIPLPEMTVTDRTVSTCAVAAVDAAFHSHASAILVPTISGKSAMEMASYRPSCPVVAIMRLPQVARRCHLIRGVHPYVYSSDVREEDWHSDMDLRLNSALNHIRERGFVSQGDTVVVVNGWNPTGGTTNTVRIIKVPEKKVKLCILSQAVSKTVGTWPDD